MNWDWVESSVQKEAGVDQFTFRGGPAEVGRAQGSVDPEFVRGKLEARMEQPHNFEHSYFRKNMAFMRREFPDLMEQMEAYGAAAGIEDFDQTYYLHIYHTGGEAEGCSSFGLLLDDDGPAMLRTYDTSSLARAKDFVDEKILVGLPDTRPHGFVGVGERLGITVSTSVNDAGLLLGTASGHRRFNWTTHPEHVNLYFTIHLLAQYCADCDDVRHFLEQYRISGVKGLTGAAVDAEGNMVGFELESENIAFLEPEEEMVIETNHWQHPDLQGPSREATPEWWEGSSYYNSQNRVQYVAYHRETFKRMRTMDELIDFSFDVHAPGRILQVPEYNIADWVTTHAIFMTSKDRKMRVHRYPLEKDQYTEITYAE